MPNPTRGEIIDESVHGDDARLLNQHIEFSHNFLPQLAMPTNLPGSRTAIAQSWPRYFNNSVTATTNNSWHAGAIYLPVGLTLTGMTFFANGAAGTPTNQWFGLWDKNLALLRGSANDTTTAWAAGDPKRLALTSTFTTLYSGIYYAGAGFTATTPPTLAGIHSQSAGSRVLTPAFCVFDNTTALTALANPLVQSAGSAGANVAPYCAFD